MTADLDGCPACKKDSRWVRLQKKMNSPFYCAFKPRSWFDARSIIYRRSGTHQFPESATKKQSFVIGLLGRAVLVRMGSIRQGRSEGRDQRAFDILDSTYRAMLRGLLAGSPGGHTLAEGRLAMNISVLTNAALCTIWCIEEGLKCMIDDWFTTCKTSVHQKYLVLSSLVKLHCVHRRSRGGKGTMTPKNFRISCHFVLWEACRKKILLLAWSQKI